MVTPPTSSRGEAQGSPPTNRQPDFRAIITALKEGNLQKAIAITVARGDGAYGYWQNVRTKIRADEWFRSPLYLQQLRDFKERHFSPQDQQWERLEELAQASLQRQCFVQSSRQDYLKHPLNQELIKIAPLRPIVYDYVIPKEFWNVHIARKEAAKDRKHANATNIGDLQTIISKAREWRQYQDLPALLACALILTGRRICEIHGDMEFRLDPENSYRAIVKGLAKTLDTDREWTIPLLMPYADIIALIGQIRMQDRLLRGSESQMIQRAEIRVFGRKLEHSMRRNIYAEAAFRERHVHQFMPSASQLLFADAVLCHENTNSLAKHRLSGYAALTFDERDGGGASNSSSGSSSASS